LNFLFPKNQCENTRFATDAQAQGVYSRTCANKDQRKCLPNLLIPLAFAPRFCAYPRQTAPQQGMRLKVVHESQTSHEPRPEFS
jgi:hypothetical protein